jgi:hypothetical protein
MITAGVDGSFVAGVPFASVISAAGARCAAEEPESASVDSEPPWDSVEGLGLFEPESAPDSGEAVEPSELGCESPMA